MGELKTATGTRRRWRIVLALAAALVLLVALRNVLIAPLLLARLAQRLRSEHGLELETGAASGNWITSLAIEDLRLRSTDAGLAWDVRVEGVELDYDLSELLRGDGEGLRSVRVGSVRGTAAIGTRGGTAASVDVGRRLAWMPDEIRIAALDFVVGLDGGRDVALSGGSFELLGDVADVRVEQLALRGDWPVRTRQLSLVGRARLGEHELRLERLDVAGELSMALESGRVRSTSGGLEVELAGRLESSPFTLVALERERAWNLHWSVVDADLARVRASVVELDGLDLAGRATGAGHLLFDEQGAWLAARLSAQDVCHQGRSFETLEAELLLRPGWLELGRLEVRQRENLLWGRALELPLRDSTMLEFLESARGEIELAVHDVGALGASPAAWIGPHRVVLMGELGPQGLALERGRLETGTGRLVLRTGNLRWREPLAEATEMSLEGDLYFADLSELGRLVDERAWAGTAKGTVEIGGTFAQPAGRLGLRGERVVVGGYELGELEARARIEGARVEVLSLRALGGLGQLDLQGSFDWRARSIESANLRASIPGLEKLLPETFERGVVALDARLSGTFPALAGEVELEALDVATRDGLELDWIEASARLAADRLEFSSFACGAAGLVAQGRGALVHADWSGPMLAEVEQALLVREGVALTLERPAAIEFDGDSLAAPSLAFRGLRGELLADVLWREGRLELDARFDDVEPMPLLAPFLVRGASVGDVDGRLVVREVDGRYELAADMRASRLVPADGWPELELELAARAGGPRAVVESLRLRAGEALSLSLAGELPFDEREPWRVAEGALQASAELRVGDARILPWRALGLPGPISGEWLASARLAGVAPDLRGFAEITGRNLSIAPESDRGVVSTLGVGEGTVRARATLDGALVLDDFELAARPGVRVAARGTLLSRPGLERWWREGRLPQDESGMDLGASWSIDDLAVLAELTPSLRRTAGLTRGEVRVGGTLAAPILMGRAELRGGELRLDAGFPALQRLEGEFRLEGERVVVERLQGELGAGPFEIDGQVRLSPRVELDLAIRGRELLVVQRPDLRVRADAQLALAGPLDALVLKGELAPQDSRWSRNFDWFRPRPRGGLGREASPPLFSIDKGALSTLRFDVCLRGGEPFRIDSNVARGSLRPNLALTGTGRAPILTGALFLDPTVVPLPAANLELRSGTLAIDRRDPLDPALDFTLSTRVRGYDIAIRAGGRYSAPELELSSVPPLPGEDILLLLLTGRAPGASLTGDDGIDAAETVIVYLGKDLLSRLFEGEGSMMERVEFQTGADVTQNGGSTAQVRIRVSGRADGVGRAIYLRGERDIYERINFGARFVMRLR